MYREKTIPVIVQNKENITSTIKRFTLVAAKGTLPYFSAGSHITTYVGEAGNIARPYSLNNNPDNNNCYEISVRLDDQSKGGSQYWHEEIKIGSQIEISYPKNHFPLSFKAKHHVFYAAGIGITPFLSMMAELKESGRSFELHYAAKTKEQCAFYDVLKEMYPDCCHFYFSKETKKLTVDSLLQHNIGTHVYFCGPESFITSFVKAAQQFGYPNGSVHFERFSAPVQINRAPFTVQVENEKEIPVSEDETLLEALLSAGIRAPYSCRVGRCGTCEWKVIEGEVDHQDKFLNKEQRKTSIITCVSRAKSGNIYITR